MSCQWNVDRTCLPDVEATSAPEDIAKVQEAVDAAVFVLWSLTGRRFGCCPVRARPCVPVCDTSYGYGSGPLWSALLYGGVWQNVSCGCRGKCTTLGPNVIHLPGPVCEITAVTVGGVVIDPSSYALEGNRLYRVGGQWPNQDLQTHDGLAGTWSVDYTRGEPPPAGSASMVGQVALEFYKSCTGGKCAFPKNVQSVTRAGVSVQMVNPVDVINLGLTGIPQVDMWVQSVNPYRQRQPAVVSSPDFPGVV